MFQPDRAHPGTVLHKAHEAEGLNMSFKGKCIFLLGDIEIWEPDGIPGVLNDETSALTDSFQDNLLAPPVYTRPANYNEWKVPEILTSGNTPEIEKWRMQKAIEKTKLLRPDLLDE